MGFKVGRPIEVGHVLSKSLELIRDNPILLVPQVIVLVVSLLEDLASAATLSVLGFVLLLVSVIVTIIVTGAYPSLVQEALDGRPVSIGNSMRQASGRFFTLLVAGIVVGIAVFVGLIALVVPGIIFLTWWVYTTPAIMLENKGVFDGMAASKAFGRDKKWSTFLLLLTVAIVAIVASSIGDLVGIASPLAGRVVGSILTMPVDAWFAVIITYTYLRYGPSSTIVPPGPEVLVPGVIPPPPPMPQEAGAPKAMPAAKFCQNCGAPLQPGTVFCPNCGQRV